MSKPMTLQQILTDHPEWADLPVGIQRTDGELDYVGQSGDVYLWTGDDVDSGEDVTPTVIFAGN